MKLVMTDQQRRAIFSLMGGEERLLPVMHQIYMHVHCDIYFTWLSVNNMTGDRLWEWFNIKHGASVHKMLKYIARAISRNGLRHEGRQGY